MQKNAFLSLLITLSNAFNAFIIKIEFSKNETKFSFTEINVMEIYLGYYVSIVLNLL